MRSDLMTLGKVRHAYEMRSGEQNRHEHDTIGDTHKRDDGVHGQMAVNERHPQWQSGETPHEQTPKDAPAAVCRHATVRDDRQWVEGRSCNHLRGCIQRCTWW